MRRRCSCPECGWIPDTEGVEAFLQRMAIQGKGFTCPRCNVHYSQEDFMAENEKKWQAQFHNHAQADLSGEQPDNHGENDCETD